MASLILACCFRNRHREQSSPTIPKHKRHPHNPPITTFVGTTPTPTAGSGNRMNMSGDYTLGVLKVENERRVRQLSEAGVMDVPHGVLSREVGTPEVAPRYMEVDPHHFRRSLFPGSVDLDEWRYRFLVDEPEERRHRLVENRFVRVGGGENGAVEGVGGKEDGANGPVEGVGGRKEDGANEPVEGVGGKEDGVNGANGVVEGA